MPKIPVILTTAWLALLIMALPRALYAESAPCVTPLECYEQAVDKLQQARDHLDALLGKLQAPQPEKWCIVQEKGKPGLQGIVYHDKAAQWSNSTKSSDYITLVTRKITLSAPTNVTIMGHDHGHTTKSSTALDVAIFIDGTLFERTAAYGWGTAFTHNTTWIPMVAVAAAKLAAGAHTIELKYHARGGSTVHFNAPLMITTLNCS